MFRHNRSLALSPYSRSNHAGTIVIRDKVLLFRRTTRSTILWCACRATLIFWLCELSEFKTILDVSKRFVEHQVLSPQAAPWLLASCVHFMTTMGVFSDGSVIPSEGNRHRKTAGTSVTTTRNCIAKLGAWVFDSSCPQIFYSHTVRSFLIHFLIFCILGRDSK